MELFSGGYINNALNLLTILHQQDFATDFGDLTSKQKNMVSGVNDKTSGVFAGGGSTTGSM